MALGDVALNADVSRESAGLVIKAEIVSLDADGRAVHPSLVGLAVQIPSVQQRAPAGATAGKIMRVEVARRHPDDLRERHRVVAGGRAGCPPQALVRGEVVEGGAPVGGRVPGGPPPQDSYV